METIKIDGRRWYVRLYFWFLALLESFINSDNSMRREVCTEGVNRCPFIRTFIWGMLVLLANVLMCLAVAYVLFSYPIKLFGGSNYLYGLAGITLFALIAYSINYAKGKWSVWFPAKKRVEVAEKVTAREETKIAAKEKSGPGFVKLVYDWLHDKFCPHLKIINPPSASAYYKTTKIVVSFDKLIIVVGVAIALLVVERSILGAVNQWLQDFTAVCTFKSAENTAGGAIKMKVDIEGKEFESEDRDLAARFLNNKSGPQLCVVYRSGKVFLAN